MQAFQVFDPEVQPANISPASTTSIFSKIRSIKKHAPEIDIFLRIVLSIIILATFCFRFKTDPRFYTITEKKIIILSVTIILMGIQNCSLMFYPFTKNYILQLYMTAILLYTTMEFEKNEGYLLVKPPQKDVILSVSYFFFSVVLFPNVAALIFGFLTLTIFVCVILVLQILASFGYDFRPWQMIPRRRLESKAELFKRKYKNLLNGYFYKHVCSERDFVSMDENPKILEDSFLTMHQAFSCVEEKDRVQKGIEKRLSRKKNDSDQNESVENEGICSICYIQFKNGSYLIELPTCGHVFHYGCLGSWVDKNPSCPICRFDLLQYYSEKFPVL